MRRQFAWLQVDVFSERPLEGNPLAVFPDARGLLALADFERASRAGTTVFCLEAEDPRARLRVRRWAAAR